MIRSTLGAKTEIKKKKKERKINLDMKKTDSLSEAELEIQNACFYVLGVVVVVAIVALKLDKLHQ